MYDYHKNDLSGLIQDSCDFFVFGEIRDTCLNNVWDLCFDVFHYSATYTHLLSFVRPSDVYYWM